MEKQYGDFYKLIFAVSLSVHLRMTADIFCQFLGQQHKGVNRLQEVKRLM